MLALLMMMMSAARKLTVVGALVADAVRVRDAHPQVCMRQSLQPYLATLSLQGAYIQALRLVEWNACSAAGGFRCTDCTSCTS